MSFANKATEKWGMISVYTGDGKGKTTAALGTAIRAVAKGRRVAIVYFDKGGTTHYSEREFLVSLQTPNSRLIEFYPTGLDRIDPVSGRFRFGVLPEDVAEAKRGLEIVEKLFTSDKSKGTVPLSLERDSPQRTADVDKSVDLLILDEINSTTALGMLNEQEVLDVMKRKPSTMEVIMTGRNAPQSFLDLADLVTEMKLIKHYFYKGIGAREGIDY